MKTKYQARSTKTNRVVARSVSKKLPFAFRSPVFLVIVLAVAVLGAYFLFKSFALTNTVTYSGSFTKKHPSASYSVTATADGTLAAVASYSNTNNFAMNVVAASGGSLACTSSGVNPMTLTCPVTKGTYAINLSGTPASKGSGSYTVTISYPVADTVPPMASITSPATGATIAGQTNIIGTATDNDGVSKVEVSVDGGAYTAANLTGTSATNQTWSYLVDTTKLTNATHTVTLKATDLTNNTNIASASYTVNNAVAPTDTTPPTVSLSSPTNGSTVSGATNFQGSSSDNVGVSKVQYKLDNATAWAVASGTTSWSFNIDTTTLANNASHVVYVQALDSSSNSSTTSESVTVSNPTFTSTAPNTQGTWVSPEGATITVNSTGIDPATGQLWTISGVYQRLSDNALNLSTVGPHYTVNVQDIVTSQTVSSASLSGGVYGNISETTYLQGLNSNFVSRPDDTLAHEYGHAWSTYYYYAIHQGSWLSYEKVRCTTSDCSLTLATDSRTNSSYSWEVTEIMADDYRLLFGTSLAISERDGSLNQQISDPRTVTGLKSWLSSNWQ